MTDPAQFQQLLAALCSVSFVSSRMPAQVFRAGYGNYQFLEFALFGRNEFWTLLQLLMESSKDQKVSLVLLDPDPEQYYYRNFGRFGALEISANASAQDYFQLLATGPESSPADALLFNSEVLVWIPPSLRWLVWAERSPQLMVLAYECEFDAPAMESRARSDLRLFTAEEALNLSSSAWRDRNARAHFAQELLANYSRGQAWADPVVSRALEVAHKVLAGKIGTVEACRAFSAIGHQLGDDMDNIFQTFTDICNKTNHLPIGTVRAEWQSNALALKDIESASYDQRYHSRVVEACKILIERLRPINY